MPKAFSVMKKSLIFPLVLFLFVSIFGLGHLPQALAGTNNCDVYNTCYPPDVTIVNTSDYGLSGKVLAVSLFASQHNSDFTDYTGLYGGAACDLSLDIWDQFGTMYTSTNTIDPRSLFTGDEPYDSIEFDFDPTSTIDLSGGGRLKEFHLVQYAGCGFGGSHANWTWLDASQDTSGDYTSAPSPQTLMTGTPTDLVPAFAVTTASGSYTVIGATSLPPSGVIPSSTSSCPTTSFTIGSADIGQGFCKAMYAVFVPDRSHLNDLSNLQTDIQTAAPFSYFYQIETAMTTLPTGSSTLPTLTLTTGGAIPLSVDMLSPTTIDAYTSSGTRSALRTLIEVSLYLSFVFMVYMTVSRMFRKSGGQ